MVVAEAPRRDVGGVVSCKLTKKLGELSGFSLLTAVSCDRPKVEGGAYSAVSVTGAQPFAPSTLVTTRQRCFLPCSRARFTAR